MASYLDLEPSLVAEMARAAMSAGRVVALRSGEVGVGAMLASLAVRGEDILLDELLPLGERRDPRAPLHRGPARAHRRAPGPRVGPLLRSLALCAASPPGESWEAVAHDGRTRPWPSAAPEARAALAPAARHPTPPQPAVGGPHDRTTRPGTSVPWWQEELPSGRRAPPPEAPAARRTSPAVARPIRLPDVTDRARSGSPPPPGSRSARPA